MEKTGKELTEQEMAEVTGGKGTKGVSKADCAKKSNMKWCEKKQYCMTKIGYAADCK